MGLYIIYMCESIDILLFLKNFISRVIKEIISTPSHRIYIEGKGWIKASNIIESDEVLLYNNVSGIVKKIELEKLEQPQVTYNFEVEDYHNYFVSEENVLVHNDCNDFKLLNDNEIKRKYGMNSEEFHKFKKDILKQANFPRDKYGNNPNLMVHKKTGQLGVIPVKPGSRLPTYPLDGLYIQDFL